MLGKQISGILAAQDFGQREILLAQPVLDPEVGNVEMSDLPKASTSADANRSCRVSENLNIQPDAQIIG